MLRVIESDRTPINFLYPPDMDEQPSSTNHSHIHSKAKYIRKGHQRYDLMKKKQRHYSYIPAKKVVTRHNNSQSQYSLGTQGSSSWQSTVSPWLHFDPAVTQRCISSNSNQFPALKSIDQLFSIPSTQQLDTLTSLQPIKRYSKIISLVTYSEERLILLGKQKARALILSPFQEAHESAVIFGMMLSENQSELIKKRQTFMEKLRTSESKYDSSLGRMSQISKELAFTYRTYLQTRKEVQQTFDSISSKNADNFHFDFHSQNTKQRYSRLLIGKNLRHTFGSLELDRLNYFKMRQYVESDRIHEYENISSFEEFTNFVNRRKPKRGRKLTLSTACSVCLSDYHQMSNPLSTCEKCHMRAHRLCYSFQDTKCGACTYQKLERKVKEVISWCFICRKAGLMVVRLSQEHYAHCFCLLVHGYWSFSEQGIEKLKLLSSSEQDYQSYFPLENQCRQLVKSIEYYSPYKKNNGQSLTSINENLKVNSWQNINAFEQVQSMEQNSEQSIMENIQIEDEIQNQKWKFSLFDLEKQVKNSNYEGCRLCSQPFFKDCYLQCQICGQKYHALCAFFSGFQLTLEEGQFFGGPMNLPKLICCNQFSAVIGQNRRFKLNYNRCVFKMLPGDLPPPSHQSLWQQ